MREQVKQRGRGQHGNMLVFGCFAMTFSAFVIVIGYSFAGLAFVQNRLQNSAEEIALAGALKLNEMGQLGQMDNMTARSRELVFAQQSNLLLASNANSAEVLNLANQLKDEAVSSSKDLSTERQKLYTYSLVEAETAMQNKFEEIAPAYRMTLPWLKIEPPTLTYTSFGRLNEQSCVAEMPTQAGLDAADQAKKYIQVNPKGLNLYTQGQDHKLPSPDDGLSFKLSSLPAPVNGQISPARVVGQGELTQVTDDYFKSAATDILTLHVQAGLGPNAALTLTGQGTASTSGSAPQE